MDHKPKYESLNYGILETFIGEKLYNLGLCKYFLDSTQKSKPFKK